MTQLKSNEKKIKKQKMLKNIFLRKYFFDFFLRLIKEMYYNENMTGRDKKNWQRFMKRIENMFKENK